MIQTITCTNCGSGSIGIQFTFDYEMRYCGECHHSNFDKWSYWFCGLECFFDWLKKNEVEEKGLPCRSCCRCGGDGEGGPTGFSGGFESNGICQVCDGTKRLKKKVFFNTHYERINNPYPAQSLS
jgi:hypothetical protein